MITNTPAHRKIKINFENSLGTINSCMTRKVTSADVCELLVKFDKSRPSSRMSIKDYETGELLGFIESISTMGNTPYAVVISNSDNVSNIELSPVFGISNNELSIINIDGHHL